MWAKIKRLGLAGRNFHHGKEEEETINKIVRDGVYGIYAPVQKAMRGEFGGLDYGQQVKFHFGENFESKVSLDHTNPMRVFFSFPYLNILKFIAIRPTAAVQLV